MSSTSALTPESAPDAQQQFTRAVFLVPCDEYVTGSQYMSKERFLIILLSGQIKGSEADDTEAV